MGTDGPGTYRPETYGEHIADIYDERYPTIANGMVDRLTRLSHDGRVLELGIGTGRVAIPLHRRGIDISGVDASPSMVARLREKGGHEIEVRMGDMADLDGLGPFRLVYVVFNTFFGLLTQQDQIRCFESVASVLEPHGHFVMEAFVPDVTRFDRNQRLAVTSIEGTDHIELDAARYDPGTQTVVGRHVIIEGGAIRTIPVNIRFAYPAELDLMAQLAGLTLVDRSGGWRGEPFTGEGIHVSTWAN